MANSCLLIDGDIYIYKASAATEKLVNFDGDNCFMLGSLSEAKEIFTETINSFLEDFKTKEYIIALSDKENFRKDILPTYKANRKNKPKPVQYNFLREWVEDEYKTMCRPGLEGDDILGILATSPVIIKNPNKIIISVDKDMKTLPARYYDSGKEERKRITEQEANYNHMLQTLTGDTADNYKGLQGVGKVNAEKIINKDMTYQEMWQAVLSAYREKGFTEKDALIQARVARILRHYDYDYKRKSVIYWDIKNEERSNSWLNVKAKVKVGKVNKGCNMNGNYKLTDSFIEDLEKMFPAIEIKSDTSLQEIYYNAGVRKVVETLKRIKDKQNKEVY